ncbi:hypothetical protein ACQR1U_30980, partial [Bradyrhizobium oligotrophicum]
RYDRPDGHIKPPERTQIWIKLGGKVTVCTCSGDAQPIVRILRGRIRNYDVVIGRLAELCSRHYRLWRQIDNRPLEPRELR